MATFTEMVTALAAVGFVGHKAYELANSLELAHVDDPLKVAATILKEEEALAEAFDEDEVDEVDEVDEWVRTAYD